jgi:hypothetical protein
MSDVRLSGDEPEDPLLRVLAVYWNEIQDLGDREQRERLRGLIAGTAESDPVEARAELADLLLDLLPPDHSVIRVLRSGVLFGRSDQADSDAKLADSFLWLSSRVLPHDAPGWPAFRDPRIPGEFDQGEFDQQVQARLISLPSLSPDEVRRHDVDPDDDGLIRLPHPDHEVQLPSFQFTAAGKPWPIVQEVNQQLDAAHDPWGVMCWWVDPHARLETVPVGLLGHGRDDLLRRAAVAVGAEY